MGQTVRTPPTRSTFASRTTDTRRTRERHPGRVPPTGKSLRGAGSIHGRGGAGVLAHDIGRANDEVVDDYGARRRSSTGSQCGRVLVEASFLFGSARGR